MNLLDKLSEAKLKACVNGVVLYVTTNGRLRSYLEKGEEEYYRVEYKEGIQYVYEKEKQIIPGIKATEAAKPSKKSTSKVSDSSDASMD